MSDAGQPGAATPGEHGDGTGPQEDSSRSGGGWMPPTGGWPPDQSAPWRRSDPPAGWAASSPRHGDLPAPLSGPPGEPPPSHVNGHRTNGHPHPPADAPASRQTPVSAPPGLPGEPRRDTDGDRLAVPAPRPAPPVEQSPGPARPEPPARHASAEQPPGPASRWAAPGLPTSAPPAVQIPPVGTAASGFEVPPGFHAPTGERASEPPPAREEPRGWDRPFPPEPAPRRYPAEPAVPDPFPATPGDGAARTADAAHGDRPFAGQRPDAPRPAADTAAGGEPAYDERPAAPRWAPGDGADRGPGAVENADGAPAASGAPDRPAEPGSAPVVDRRASLPEPDWSGPNWNRPSWGHEWAPPWARVEPEAAGRRARDDADQSGRGSHGEPEPSGRRARDESEPTERDSAGERWAPPGRRSRPETDPAEAGEGRRARDERPTWAAEPQRAYEPVRTEPPPAPAEPGRRADIRPAYEPSAEAASRNSTVPGTDRPAWTGEPRSAVPAPAPAPAATTARETGEAPQESHRPFRLRPENPAVTDPVGGTPASGPTSSGPATSAAAGVDRIPSAPAPTSAPPYAARRSAPEPAPTAEPADADRLPDPAAVLPQRVPAEPDVPVVPEPPAVEPPAETPELARIATHLRRDDEPAPLHARPEGFDVAAILAAVRGVAGVRDAELRRTPAGAHSLRLDLADGADAAEVSRHVARLLQERMGLAAAPQNLPGLPAEPTPPVRRRAAEPAGGEPRPAEGRSGVEPRPPAARPDALPSRGERRDTSAPETPRRRRQSAGPHRGRATVDGSAVPVGPGATGSPATLGASYTGGQVTTTETAPSRPLDTGGRPGPRVVLDHVQVSTFGLDATVEVRLVSAGSPAAGYATGPAVDGYVLRLCAVAAAAAVDELLRAPGPEPDRGRCFVEHAAVVPFGNCEVATVVVLLVCDGWVEQLAGSALVAGDPRQAVVRATLAAVNRRLEALLA
ncbi:hypothetical protein [Micromonospora sp. NPDC126480]|uniref:hypothetical protein n=1 Tax=Micromonospora sp. NPDC126480 TaxID=3155312 RepID=UPI003333C915